LASTDRKKRTAKQKTKEKNEEEKKNDAGKKGKLVSAREGEPAPKWKEKKIWKKKTST